jgi:hypothetical protein
MFWCFFRGTVGHRRRFERLSWRAVYMYNDFLLCIYTTPEGSCNVLVLSWRAVYMYNDFLLCIYTTPEGLYGGLKYICRRGLDKVSK